MAKSKVTITESGPVEAQSMDLVPADVSPPLELKIIKEQVGFITTNAKDLLVMAKEKCAEYADLSRFEGDPDYAKKERAALNNAEKKVAEMAKEVTTRWNAPLEEFAATMKDVRAAFKGASQALDVGIKDAEKKEADKKTADIRAYFDTKKFDLVPFEKLWNDRWLLKLSKMKDIEKELDEKIEKIYSEIQILERIPDYGTPAKAFYLKTLDMAAALTEVDILKAAAEKIAREKVEREERELLAQVEENKRNLVKESWEEFKNDKEDEITGLAAEALGIAEAPEPEKPTAPEILTTALSFKGTKNQLKALRAFMSMNKIAYKKIAFFGSNEEAYGYIEDRNVKHGEVFTAVIYESEKSA
jgi:hypothetical protein